MTRQHDADLCERIRALEQRIAELEAQPRVTYVPWQPHYCFTGCPIHPATDTWPVTVTWSNTSWSDATGYSTPNFPVIRGEPT